MSNAKNPRRECFLGCPLWNSMGKYFFSGQRLILFVCENYCNCASRRSFSINEFFKCVQSFKIEAAQTHFLRTQMDITRGVNAHLRAQSCPSNQNTGCDLENGYLK
jgi:hypothetical protein